MILASAIAVCALVWIGIKKQMANKNIWAFRATATIASFLAFFITIGILSYPAENQPEKKPDSAAKEESKPTKPDPPSKPEPEVKQSANIGISTWELLDSLKVESRESAPLASGEPRDNIKISKFVHVEAIGDPNNLSRWSAMFGFAKDDQSESVITGLSLATLLVNTFPDWKKEGDNPVVFITKSIEKLAKQIEKKKSEVTPIVHEQDGKIITIKAVPALGLFFMTVEPKDV